MDLCTLEFCKLFAESKGRHHWTKVISNQAQFSLGPLRALKMTQLEFDQYIASVKFYRDKYVAHLDDEIGGNYPVLTPGKTAIAYLFDYLLKFEDEGGFFPDSGGTAADYYSDREDEATDVYTYAPVTRSASDDRRQSGINKRRTDRGRSRSFHFVLPRLQRA